MPHVDSSSIYGYFPEKTPKDALDLLLGLLEYDPKKRLNPASALAHPFFDELRLRETRMPDGSKIPD